MHRNLKLYPYYAASSQALFWLPVYMLYFVSELGLAQALLLESIYYGTVVLLELPSGYLSDRWGRRVVLIAAGLAGFIAHGLFVGSDTFAGFAIAQMLLAASIAFRSGSDTSLHFDSLVLHGDPDEYGKREARIERISFVVTGAAAILGGAAATVDLRGAFVLAAIASLIETVLAASMNEPLLPGQRARKIASQARAIGRSLGPTYVRWLFGFGVVMTVLNHIPYEFYQPLIDRFADSLAAHQVPTPVMTAAHAALAMFVAAPVAGWSTAVARRIGTPACLMMAAILQAAIICLMAWIAHPVVVFALLLRSVPRALMTAPLRAAIAPHVGSSLRATWLSLQSLVGRLGFAAVLVALGTSASQGIYSALLLSAQLTLALIAVLGAFGAIAWTNRHPPDGQVSEGL